MIYVRMSFIITAQGVKHDIIRDDPNYLILSAFIDHELVGEVSIQIEAKEAYLKYIYIVN